MKITLNNRPEEIDGKESITIQDLLTLKTFTFRMLVIKINGTVVKRDDYATTIVHANDDVKVIHLISGG
ncbi:MAG TPA: sulfur carrier protein ThiS [Williamwhitmania sp.]|nr:sulfur carrier protein ThiS [Williamwhitmania sp.]